MNVEELFREWCADEMTEFNLTTFGATVGDMENFAQFCIEKERERCLSILDGYRKTDAAKHNEPIKTALTFVWHEIKVEP